MKKIKIYNVVILDKSFSMDKVRRETVDGLNKQIDSIKESQKEFADTQEHLFSLVTFSTEVDKPLIWNAPIETVNHFTQENYIPNGWTALVDAIGITMTELKKEIESELSYRKANVCITILTDGEENKSKKFHRADVAKLIENHEETKQWIVTFAGCGKNVLKEAETLGIRPGNTLSYDPGAVGTSAAFETMSVSRHMYTKGLARGHKDNQSFYSSDNQDDPAGDDV